MCVPSPGPRCSYHAHKEYLVALQKFELAQNADEKIRLGKILEEKTLAFYSTPRGQNFLRREADASEGLKKQEWLTLLKKAEETRSQQMHDFQEMVNRKDSSFKEKTLQEGKKFSRYMSAVALALLFFKENCPELETTIIDKQTLKVGDLFVFVLPLKYQNVWGLVERVEEEYVHTDTNLATVLNSNLALTNLGTQQTIQVFDWFSKEVEQRYTMVAIVNVATQDVAVTRPRNLNKIFNVNLKLKKRLGGTTYSFKEVNKIEPLLHGTVFQEGKIVELEKFRKTIITGIPPQPKNVCVLSEDFFLGWRENKNGEGYFEVRRRHISNKYDLIVKLKARRNLFVTGIDDEAKKVLNKVTA